MKQLIIMICCLLVVCACEKPLMQEDTGVAEEDGNLIIRVYKFENTPFESLTRTAVTDVCKRLNFAVYYPDGTRIKQVNQSAGDANFGSCSFMLDEGTYRLVVVAHSSNGNPTMADPTCVKFTNTQGFTETFLCSQEVTLDGAGVEMGVSMVRIVSLCRFVISDDIPASVKKLRFYYTGGSGAFDALTGLGCVNSKQDVKYDVTSGQKQFDLYTFLHDAEGTIHLTVSALDESGNELFSRQLDVPLTQNHITWVTGNFFSGSGSGSGNTNITDITVNTDWAGEHYMTF